MDEIAGMVIRICTVELCCRKFREDPVEEIISSETLHNSVRDQREAEQAQHAMQSVLRALHGDDAHVVEHLIHVKQATRLGTTHRMVQPCCI